MRMNNTTLTNINQKTLCKCAQCGEICLSGDSKHTGADGLVCNSCIVNYYWCSNCDEFYLTDELASFDGDEDFYFCPACYAVEKVKRQGTA